MSSPADPSDNVVLAVASIDSVEDVAKKSPGNTVEVRGLALKRYLRRLNEKAHELANQHKLIHRIFTNQRLWHSRLSLFVILLSSTMTLMSSLTFILPAHVIEEKQDRIPNIILSFMVTIVSSILKWGGWDSRCEETSARGKIISDCISSIKAQKEEIRGWIADAGIREQLLDGSGNKDIMVPVPEAGYNDLRRVHRNAIDIAAQTRTVLFSLQPSMVADYEKRILETTLQLQNTDITRTFAQMFQTTLSEYESGRGFDSTTFERMINEQRHALSTHEHILQYASDYKGAMYAERGVRRGGWYRFRTRLWNACCRIGCLEPEHIPIGPVELPVERLRDAPPGEWPVGGGPPPAATAAAAAAVSAAVQGDSVFL